MLALAWQAHQIEQLKGATIMTRLLAIEGIGEVYFGKFFAIGIRTVEALLEAGKTPEGRKELAEKAGISGKAILEWVNRADLFRIRGIAEEYSDLLESAGVDTVPELAQRRADHLFEKMKAVNAEKKLVRRLPTRDQVGNWVEQAKNLPRIVTY
jgi:predicted flap endonuclease-1-like 5' DNA nuclease